MIVALGEAESIIKFPLHHTNPSTSFVAIEIARDINRSPTIYSI